MNFFSKTWQALVNVPGAILKGEFLLRIHVDRYFIHILYTFLLLWLTILIDMRVEKTMVKVEENKSVLTDLKIYHAQKTVQLVSIKRISTIKDMLEKDGSKVTFPEKPAARIEK